MIGKAASGQRSAGADLPPSTNMYKAQRVFSFGRQEWKDWQVKQAYAKPNWDGTFDLYETYRTATASGMETVNKLITINRSLIESIEFLRRREHQFEQELNEVKPERYPLIEPAPNYFENYFSKFVSPVITADK
jgi:hypothetical protein